MAAETPAAAVRTYLMKNLAKAAHSTARLFAKAQKKKGHQMLRWKWQASNIELTISAISVLTFAIVISP